jgi:hypothetical protein
MMALLTSSESLLQRIRSEFRAHPELRVTPWEFRLRWALTPQDSWVVMRQLLTAGFLREDQDGALVRDERWTPKRH